jgi:hypothetical protein
MTAHQLGQIAGFRVMAVESETALAGNSPGQQSPNLAEEVAGNRPGSSVQTKSRRST